MNIYPIGFLAIIAICNAAIGFTNIPGCGETKEPLEEKCGRAAYKGEQPWAVQLGVHGDRRPIVWTCGGSLLTRRHVLTAAHCVDSEDEAQKIIARLGDLFQGDPSKGAIEMGVEKAIKHKKFNESNVYPKFDIAILYLSKHVVFTDLIIPICLPEKRNFNINNLDGQTATVAGWGLNISQSDPTVPGLLKVANVTIFSNELCAKKYHELTTITNNLICAGKEDGGVDSCTGDSGGPLIVKQGKTQFQVGIVSFAHECALKEYPGVNTRVSSYLDWIHEHLTK